MDIDHGAAGWRISFDENGGLPAYGAQSYGIRIASVITADTSANHMLGFTLFGLRKRS